MLKKLKSNATGLLMKLTRPEICFHFTFCILHFAPYFSFSHLLIFSFSHLHILKSLPLPFSLLLLLTPYSLLLTPYSLLLTPYSLLLTPYSLLLKASCVACETNRSGGRTPCDKKHLHLVCKQRSCSGNPRCCWNG